MDWLELVAPSAAIFALFLAIALIVLVLRHGRAIRRLEERLADAGAAAEEEALERVRQLQQRTRLGEGARAPSGRSRLLGVGAGVLVALVIAAGAVWFLVLRDDPGGESAVAGDTTTTTGGGGTTAAERPRSIPDDVVGNPPTIDDKARFTITIFNASGISGAAREQVQPLLVAEGYQIGTVDDSPDGRDDLARSVVMWPQGKRALARNVAKDLGITSAPPLDGYTDEQLDGGDAVVVIGQDIQSLLSLGTTTSGSTAAAPSP